VFNDRDQATSSGADADNDGAVDAATAVSQTTGGSTKKYVWGICAIDSSSEIVLKILPHFLPHTN
jgi:hypothetical protein